MSTEDVFECQVRFLERELAAARETLRDRFAMAALAEFVRVTNSLDEMDPEIAMKATAIIAYRMADAMMEARKS